MKSRLLYAESHCEHSVLFLSTALSSYLTSFCCQNIGQTVPHAYTVGFSCPRQSQISQQWVYSLWNCLAIPMPGQDVWCDAEVAAQETGILGISLREYGDLIQEGFVWWQSFLNANHFVCKGLPRFLKLREDTYLLELLFCPLSGISYSGAFFFFFSFCTSCKTTTRCTYQIYVAKPRQLTTTGG